MKLKAQEVADLVKGRLVRGNGGRTATGVSTDTRSLVKGQGFIALKGPNFDGHAFIKDADKKGAAWIIAEKGMARDMLTEAALIETDDTLKALGMLAANHLRSFDIKVAAITGSLGKSTVKEMAASIISSKGRVLKNKGNLNNRIGVPQTIFKINRSHRYAVLETACNEPGEIGELTRIAGPDAGLITCVAPVHLEGLGSVEGVARAKAEMIKELSAKSTFVLNLDDPLIKRHARNFKGNIIGFSKAPVTDFQGECLSLVDIDKEVIGGRPRINFLVERRKAGKRTGKPVRFYLWTLARHNAVNALAAASLGRAFNVSLAEAAEKLRGFKGLPGRGEVIRSPGGAFIMNDTYNSSPESVANALATMCWWKGPMRGVAVLGDMYELGEKSPEYHREAGRRAVREGVSLLVAKGEMAEETVEAAKREGLPADAVFAVKDNARAAAILNKKLQRGDWVLVKGSRSTAMEEVVKAISG